MAEVVNFVLYLSQLKKKKSQEKDLLAQCESSAYPEAHQSDWDKFLKG
jgi:hypothetical protein